VRRELPAVTAGNRVALRREDGLVDLESTVEEVHEEVKRWWMVELEKAGEILERGKADFSKGINWFERRKFEEILSVLKI
jgi:hypothetical protein